MNEAVFSEAVQVLATGGNLVSIAGSLPSSEWRPTTAVAGELQLVEDP